MTRFCWRERTERVNWRLLKDLHVADVLRRGDPTLLEPFALHVTFAKLPVVVSALQPTAMHTLDQHHDHERGRGRSARGGGGGGGSSEHGGALRREQERNAWFLVRVLQLAMEYLLFLRARDVSVVDSLQQELELCEREGAFLAERAKKWKDRARSGDKQVEKLHQMLQNIAKLLQLEGATPTAVSTIEHLLKEMVPTSSPGKRSASDPSNEHSGIASEARVCYLCGKVFSSKAFLEKHHIRRHTGEDPAETVPVKPRRAWENPPTEQHNAPILAPTADNQADSWHIEKSVKNMLVNVEHALKGHQESLRSLAQEEASKINRIYEQLHVETQLTNELKQKRLEIEQELEKDRRDLDAVRDEKKDVSEQVQALKEQLRFLSLKKNMESPMSEPSRPSSRAQIPPDASSQLEICRLSETLSAVNSALSVSRGELKRVQDVHAVVLKERHELEQRLHEAQNHAQRIELRLQRDAQVDIPVMKTDQEVQTTEKSFNTTEVQTVMDTPAPTPVAASISHAVMSATASTQVSLNGRELVELVPFLVDAQIQTDPAASTPKSPNLLQPPGNEVSPSLDSSNQPTAEYTVPLEMEVEHLETSNAAPASGEISVDEYNAQIDMLMYKIDERAKRSALLTASKAINARLTGDNSYVSLPRRKFLRSHYEHDEATVKHQVEGCMQKLATQIERFSVTSNNGRLSSQHAAFVQQALHAHVATLPTAMLEKMVQIENAVNGMITREWIPDEKSRELALKRLTINIEEKNKQSQGLVRQAMSAFISHSPPDKNSTPRGALHISTPSKANDHGFTNALESEQAIQLNDNTISEIKAALADTMGAAPIAIFPVSRVASSETTESKPFGFRAPTTGVDEIEGDPMHCGPIPRDDIDHSAGANIVLSEELDSEGKHSAVSHQRSGNNDGFFVIEQSDKNQLLDIIEREPISEGLQNLRVVSVAPRTSDAYLTEEKAPAPLIPVDATSRAGGEYDATVAVQSKLVVGADSETQQNEVSPNCSDHHGSSELPVTNAMSPNDTILHGDHAISDVASPEITVHHDMSDEEIAELTVVEFGRHDVIEDLATSQDNTQHGAKPFGRSSQREPETNAMTALRSSSGSRSGSSISQSLVASSELSFNASLPSLGSTGGVSEMDMSRSFGRSSGDELPKLAECAEASNPDDTAETTEIRSITQADDDQNLSHSDEQMVPSVLKVLENGESRPPSPTTVSERAPTTNAVASVTNITSFDDLDIEEVELT